jgi:hypothetical protein
VGRGVGSRGGLALVGLFEDVHCCVLLCGEEVESGVGSCCWLQKWDEEVVGGRGVVFIRLSCMAGPRTRDKEGIRVCLPKYSANPQTVGWTW